MTERDESFFTRWSKRKIESKEGASESVHPSEPVPDRPGDRSEAASAPQTFDPKAFPLPIPELEEIVAGFDMRPFLQKGVPESLKNAALRKLWHCDPAISEFVSPALDYAHDYNNPDTIAGFGNLTSSQDLTDLLSNLFSTGDKASDTPETNDVLPEPNQDGAALLDHHRPETTSDVTHSEIDTKSMSSLQIVAEDVADKVQNEHPENEAHPKYRDKKSQLALHGSALPE